MEFHFEEGCLPEEECNKLIWAQEILKDAFYPVWPRVFTDENGKAFKTFDLISEPDEIREATQIFADLVEYL